MLTKWTWRRRLRHNVLLFLAYTRWSKSAVCEMSRGRGLFDDFHDYRDATLPFPMHHHVYECRRCGKEFTI